MVLAIVPRGTMSMTTGWALIVRFQPLARSWNSTWRIPPHHRNAENEYSLERVKNTWKMLEIAASKKQRKIKSGATKRTASFLHHVSLIPPPQKLDPGSLWWENHFGWCSIYQVGAIVHCFIVTVHCCVLCDAIQGSLSLGISNIAHHFPFHSFSASGKSYVVLLKDPLS